MEDKGKEILKMIYKIIDNNIDLYMNDIFNTDKPNFEIDREIINALKVLKDEIYDMEMNVYEQ